MIADFRSDTITKPTPAMLETMYSAKVGDDVFGEDPTVNALQEKAAELFGMEAALFCSSGTQTNQLALAVHTGPGTEVICHENSHIHLYEGGGIAFNAFAAVNLLDGKRGMLTANQVKDAIHIDDVHYPQSVLVSLENTFNKGGGAIYDFEEIKRIKTVCLENNMALHLDGARLFNALKETPQSTLEYGQVFDSISICLSKGLGCPVGSLLMGTKDFIKAATRKRKAWGGGWRQAGFLAAAGIYALDHHVERLAEDHKRAKDLGESLKTLPFVVDTMPIETNIAIIELQDSILAADFVKAAEQVGVRCVRFGKHLVRFVTHLDVNDDHISFTKKALSQLNFA
ncbi:threonine aldolase family protein [Jiulongibacter sp. NS-SX5]|uniref:threonine aldolase family protein n=1 Tax=Jiulongibacter sp. NS-SX5 TaxID=3463854 RepID=UPI004059E2F3